jgi:hypothetical protein
MKSLYNNPLTGRSRPEFAIRCTSGSATNVRRVQLVDTTCYLSTRKDGVLRMKYRTRIYDTAEQKAEMWDRWQRGGTINASGRAFDRVTHRLAASSNARAVVVLRLGVDPGWH